MYAAFARGDVAAILEKLTDDVVWETDPASTAVPWLQPRRGKAGAAAFFQSLSGLQIRKFLPSAVLEGPDGLVVSLIDLEATVIATGKPLVETDAVHIWRFDASGRARSFRHRVDTKLQEQASRP
jgi:ketosteroid isomerase-like protein